MVSLGSEKRFQSDILDDFDDNSEWKVIREEMSIFDDSNNFGEEYVRNEEDVILWGVLRRELINLNSNVTEDNVDLVLDEVVSSFRDGFDLLSRNRSFSKLLRSGGDIMVNGDGVSFDLIDFDNPENNDFVVVEEFSVSTEDGKRRPDLVFLVNGIPLVVSELKSSAKGNSVSDAIRDLEEVYQNEIEDLFVPNVLCIAANQSLFRYGGINCGIENYDSWSSEEDMVLEDVSSNFLDLLSPNILLSILEDFVFFKENRGSIDKIIPWRHQFEAVNNIIGDVSDAIDNNEFRRHLIGHVQGSGKSFAMLYAGRLLFKKFNSQVFILVDENNLEDQFISDLRGIDNINFTQANSGDHLEDLIEMGESGIVLTTVQKFGEVDYENINPGNKNPVVFADEAHRFLDAKLGSMMEATLDKFHYYGFTGTPTDGAFELFSIDREENFLHEYSMGDAVKDEAILPVNMEYRGDVWNMDYAGMDIDYEEGLEDDLSYEEKRKIIDEEVTPALIGRIEPRVDNITDDIINHYENHVKPFKAMVVTPFRENAAIYGKFLKEKMKEGQVEVLYSDSGKQSKEIVQRFEKNDKEQERIREKFKDPDSELKIVVVCDMLLTGFDAPILQTVFLDRDVSEGHTLLQIIARTNRNRENKAYGEVIDYQGVITEFEDLVDYSSEEIEKFKTKDKESFIEEFEEMLKELREYFPEDISNKIENGEYPDLEDCLNTFDTTTKQEDFLRDFKELRILFENIEPHKKLTKYNKEYEIYEKIYQAMNQTKTTTKTKNKQDIVKKAIENNTNHRLEETNYKLEIENIDSNNSIKVVEKQVELQDFLNKNKHKDPRYYTLSEKVRDIIDDWDSNTKTNKKAIEHLDEIFTKIEKIKKEHEESELDETSRSLMFHLKDYGIEEEQAKQTSQNITKSLDLNNIDKFYSGEFNGIKKKVIEKLAEENLINQVNNYEQLTETIIENQIKN